MAGDRWDLYVTADDVSSAARLGEKVWRIDASGRTWKLTLDGLLAIDDSWDGDPDELSPMVAQTIAARINERQPWRQAEDPERPLGWAAGIDTNRPSVSRVYDCLLGGVHNLGADRRFAEQLIAAEPLAPVYARANRAFLWRAVRFLVAAGVRQFLDLGSGVPTLGNVHEVAQAAVPDARVVYVDFDPIAAEHSRQMLAGNRYATAIEVDLRRPEVVIGHPDTRQLIDFTAPVGVLMVAVLHFVPDADDPAGIIARYRKALAPGSYLAVSHACPPPVETPHAVAARDSYDATANPLTLRPAEDVAALLEGWSLVAPGLVELTRWRPDEPEESSGPAFPGVAGVAHLAGANMSEGCGPDVS
jgi:trans-aconitate methyltransferase